ncbi:MAG: radical SAM protein [Clostridia bacterium]
MTNAIICIVNSKYIHSSLAPWYLKASVTDENINIDILEWTINRSRDELFERIRKENPKVLALSCYIWNIEYILPLVNQIKTANPEIIIVLGGPEVSYNSREVLDNSLADYVISGEGEIPFAKIMTAISSGSKIEGIDGVFGKDFDSETFISCETPPNPYTKEYFDSLNTRIVYIETVRGCPFSCSFCLSGRCGGMKYFPMDRVKNDIITLANSGTKTIKFIDRSFNVNAKRALEIILFICENYDENIPKNVEFHFEIAGDILTKEIISALNTAPKGLFRVEIGLQSFNEKTLNAVNRKTNIEKLKQNITALVVPKNVHVHIDLIAGLPYENFDSFKESFNTAFSLNPNVLQLGFLKLLHGSPMEENPMGNFSKTAPYQVINTPWINENELARLHFAEEALERLYNSERFTDLLNFAIDYFDNAFDMFLKFGEESGWKYGESLDEFTTKTYNFFSIYTDKTKLKDIMIEERLSSNSVGKLPPVLRNENYKMGKLLVALDKHENLKRQKSVKRSAAFLESTGEIIYIDYTQKQENGRYKINKILLSEVESNEK